jgi:hypothetical protein
MARGVELIHTESHGLALLSSDTIQLMIHILAGGTSWLEVPSQDNRQLLDVTLTASIHINFVSERSLVGAVGLPARHSIYLNWRARPGLAWRYKGGYFVVCLLQN